MTQRKPVNEQLHSATKAMSLIEVVVVVMILAVLAYLAIPNPAMVSKIQVSAAGQILERDVLTVQLLSQTAAADEVFGMMFLGLGQEILSAHASDLPALAWASGWHDGGSDRAPPATPQIPDQRLLDNLRRARSDQSDYEGWLLFPNEQAMQSTLERLPESRSIISVADLSHDEIRPARYYCTRSALRDSGDFDTSIYVTEYGMALDRDWYSEFGLYINQQYTSAPAYVPFQQARPGNISNEQTYAFENEQWRLLFTIDDFGATSWVVSQASASDAQSDVGTQATESQF